MKRFIATLLCAILCVQPVFAQEISQIKEETTQVTQENTEATEENTETTEENAETTSGIEVSAPSALLMEASTGQVIYEKDADTKRPPASVTKIMTLLLIFDALESGKIKLGDEVTTSEYAASMGGSQVFLDISFLGFLTLWPRQLWPSSLYKVSGLLWSKFFFTSS